MNDNAEQTRYATFTDFLNDYVDVLEEEHKYGERIIFPPPRYIIRCTESGDYVGGFIEESNRKVLLEDCPSIVEEVHQGFDYSPAVIDPEHFAEWDSGELEILCDYLNQLERYPALNDDLWVEMEDEAKWNAWEEEIPYVEQALADSAEEACSVGNGYTVDAKRLLSDWLDACSEALWECNIIIVEGKSVWVETERLIELILSACGDELEDLATYIVPQPWNDPTQPEFHESGSVGRRASIHNAKAQAERYRKMGLLGGDNG